MPSRAPLFRLCLPNRLQLLQYLLSPFRRLLMAESYSISISKTTGILNNKLPKYPSLSSLPTPKKLSFFASCPSWVSLKSSKFSPLNAITLVARASNWAQQQEERREEIGANLDGVGLREETFRDDNEDYYTEPAQEARIYVGNLPFAADSKGLAQLFNRAGIVETAEVMYKRGTKQSKGFGFVTMSNIEESQRAVRMFHRYNLNGRLLFVNKAAPRGSRPREPRLYELGYQVYVGNLSREIDDSRLEQIFSEYGKVVTARTVRDQETGHSRGFGFVTMTSERELHNAMVTLDGQILDGKEIRVSVAEERPRHP